MRKIKVEIGDYTYDWLRDIARQSGKRVEEYASELLRTHVSLEELRREREKLESEIRELEAKRQKLQEQVRRLREAMKITTISTDEGYLILHDVGEEIIITAVDIEAGRVASATTKPQMLKIFCREESEEGG